MVLCVMVDGVCDGVCSFFFLRADFSFLRHKTFGTFSFLRQKTFGTFLFCVDVRNIFFLVFVEDVRTIRLRRKDRRTDRPTDKGLRRKRERRVKSRCWP